MPGYRTLIAAALAAIVLLAPAAPALAAQPPAPSPSGLVITQTDVYTISYSPLTYVVGQIENQSHEAIGVKTIAVSLIAPDGSTIGTANAHTKPSFLDPGQRSGWVALVAGTPNLPQSSGPLSVRVDTEAGPAQTGSLPPVTHALSLEGVTVQPPQQYSTATRIVGQVVNMSDQTVQRPQIIGSILSTIPEANNDLIDAGGGTGALDTLAPGQSAPFQITLNQGGTLVARGLARYELYAEARVAR